MMNVDYSTVPTSESQAQSFPPLITPLQQQQPPLYSQQASNIEPDKHKSKWKIFFLIFALAIILLGLGIGSLIFQGINDSKQVQQEVTNFLENVSSDNLDLAYSMTASEFQNKTPREDFVSAMKVFKAQYSGFNSQEQSGFSVEADVGQPTMYKYFGEISYTDGDQGELSAVLIKENSEWKILGIEVFVDVKRMEKFQQSMTNPVLGVSIEN